MNKYFKINNILFSVSYFLLLLYSFFGNIENIGSYLKILSNISLIIIIFEFIININKYKPKEIINIIIMFFLSIIFIFSSNNFILIKLLLIIIASKGIKFDKIVLFDIKLRFIFLLIMYTFFLLGISTDFTAFYNGHTIHSIGFSNPNILGLHTFLLCTELLYIYRNKISASIIGITILLMSWSYYYSGCRTAIFMYVLSLLLFFVYSKNKDFFKNKIIKFFVIYSPIITSITVFIFYVLFVKNTAIGIGLDNILSARLSNIKFFSKMFPITLFGVDMSVANKSCDIAFVYILYSFGVIGFIFSIFFFQKIIRNFYKYNLIHLVILIYILILYGLSEKLWLFVDYNVLIVIFSFILLEQKEIDIYE